MPIFVKGSPTGPDFILDTPKEDFSIVERIKLKRADKRKLHDLVVVPQSRLRVASQRFKDIVEELEPNVHEFKPLDLTDRTGNPVKEQYYQFFCGQVVPAVLSWRSGFDGVWWKNISEEPIRGIPDHKTDGIVMSGPEIARKHIWINKFHGPMSLVFSDELWERLQPFSTHWLAVYPGIKVVDEPWLVRREIGPWLDWMKANLNSLHEQMPALADQVIAEYKFYRKKAEEQARD